AQVPDQANAKGKKASEPKGKGKPPSGKAGGKGQQSHQNEPPSVKGGTKLVKRGEEINEDKYIGDEPDNGISRYILLTGFEDTELMQYLCAAEIGVHALIRLKMRDGQHLEELIVRQKAEKLWGSKAGGQTIEELHAEQERIEADQQKMNEYWLNINRIMRDNPFGLLGNIATLDYVVEPSLLPEDLTGTENRLQFGSQMFDEIATMLYDLVDFRRQWENYTNHVKVFHLAQCAHNVELSPTVASDLDRSPSRSRPSVMSSEPEEVNKSVTNDPGTSLQSAEIAGGTIDMRIYQETLDGLPTEHTSVELIFYAILEQVIK
ncbi:unnamed protein product, partial [Echinostoma caproni]|uniref:OTU domain-containing protein n=1 Tax=Echinostoma caproni TaxID=27848 RepID=A0A183B5N3_9TREM